MSRSGVYFIRCLVTNEMYIGATKDYDVRVLRHQQLLARGAHYSKKLQAAYDAHGCDQFAYVLFKEVPPDQLQKFEHEAIRKLKPAFNTYALKPTNYMLATISGVSKQTIAYRKSIGLIGDALTAPAHGNKKRAEVRNEMLTPKEIVAKYKLPLKTIVWRFYQGETGERLIRPLNSRKS